MAAGKSEFGLIGVVGGITMIELLAYIMRSVRGRIAAVGNEHYCGNLLWQLTVTMLALKIRRYAPFTTQENF